MRLSISIIVIIVVAALTWFGLRPTTTQTTDKIITEVIPSKTAKEEPRIVVAPRPKTVTDTPSEIVETIETVTNSTQIVADYQETTPIQEESTITIPEDDIVNFLSDQIQDESLFGLLIQKQIIDRFVIFIDNIPRKNLSRKFLPIKTPGGLFLSNQNETGEFIAEENHERYYNYVRLIERIDTEAAIDLFITLYPHFQRAYEQLGYPDRSFHTRLTYVIDHLLETPEKYDPIYLERPKVLFVFADPELEKRSAGQKLLLRTGAENVQNVKRVLKRVQRQLRSHEI